MGVSVLTYFLKFICKHCPSFGNSNTKMSYPGRSISTYPATLEDSKIRCHGYFFLKQFCSSSVARKKEYLKIKTCSVYCKVIFRTCLVWLYLITNHLCYDAILWGEKSNIHIIWRVAWVRMKTEKF